MDDIEERDPSAVAPQPIAEEEDERPGYLIIAQFFIIPLVVIAVCVGLFVMFGLMTGDSRSASDYLNEIRSGSKTRRYQAAYELSKILTYKKDLAKEPGFVADLGRVFQESAGQEPELRRYLALALGQVPDPAAVDPLLSALDDPDSQTRIYVIWALGAVGDPRARAPVSAVLSDADAGVRKMACFTLGELKDPAAADALHPLLEDSVADVQWNAALALSELGDAAAVPVLRRMLDRSYLDRVSGILPGQKEEAMVNAIRGLALLRDAGATTLLTRLSQDDPSLDVRSAALQALQALPQPG
jgi:HEAT repeat protein